ncbi:MAG: hypothetical protein QOF21_821, partial [Actinomycetota bacterium]
MADLTDPGDERPEPPAKLPSQRRPSKPVQKIPDADRERVIERLRQHAGVGDLTLDDFAERAGVVFAATTSMELEAVTADLPVIAAPTTATTPMVGDTRRRKISRWAIGIMGGATRKGRWRVGDTFNVVCVMGGAEIDLREAEFDAGELHITCVCIMGGATFIVPEGIEVDLGGIAIMGGKDAKLANVPLIPGAPRIRITAVCIMGGMDVRSRRPAAELAAAKREKREAERARRELRRAERDRRRPELPDVPRVPRAARPARPARATGPLGAARDLKREVRDTLRTTIHESIRESREHLIENLEAGRSGRALDQPWQTTDEDAAAVRRRLKRNGRPEGTVTILFTDIEGSTELIEGLGDAEAMVLIKEHNELVRQHVATCGGYEVKFRGDGFMLAFTSAASGLRCAIAIQREMETFAERHPEVEMRVAIGINAGEAVPEGNDFLGTAVNIAARLSDVAQGGDVLVTSVVRDLVA